MITNKKQLTEIFNVTSRTIEDWESKGMPIRSRPGRGKSNEYDTAECIDWRLRYMVNGGRHTSAKERREEAEAALKEMELAEKTKQFVLAEDVEFVLTSSITAARASLLSSARKIRTQIEKKYGVKISLSFITDRVHESLSRLADGYKFEEIAFNYHEGEISFTINDEAFQIVKMDDNNMNNAWS